MPFDSQGAPTEAPPVHEAVVDEQPLHPPNGTGAARYSRDCDRAARARFVDLFVGYVGASDTTRTGIGLPERSGWPDALSGGDRVAPAHLPDSYEFNARRRWDVVIGWTRVDSMSFIEGWSMIVT